MEGRKQFTFYRSFYNAVKKIPPEHQLEFLLLIIRYALDHVEPKRIRRVLASEFELAKPNLDSAWRKAMAGSIGGKISKRGCAENKQTHEKISKIKNKDKIEIENETETKVFADFWNRYPVQIGKEAAEAAWVSVCEEHDSIMICDRLEDWISSISWRLENGRFIPKAAKWLEEKWFLQQPPRSIPNGATGSLGKAELEAIQRLLEEP